MEKDFIELTEEDYADVFLHNPLTEALDEVLDFARKHPNGLAPWIPISGLTGSGKTSTIKSWLKRHHLKNWYIEGFLKVNEVEVDCYPNLSSKPKVSVVISDTLEHLLTPSKKKVKVLFSPEDIDAVNQDTIVVIDDYDRYDEEARKALRDIIETNRVVDIRADNEDKTRVIRPLMIIVVIDTCNVANLSEQEKELFALDDQ